MKKILLIALIALSVSVACKKENIHSCIVGKWKYAGSEQNGSFKPSNLSNFYIFNDNGTYSFDILHNGTIYHTDGTYTISGKTITLSNGQKDNITCGESQLKLNSIPSDSNDPPSNIYEVYNKN